MSKVGAWGILAMFLLLIAALPYLASAAAGVWTFMWTLASTMISGPDGWFMNLVEHAFGLGIIITILVGCTYGLYQLGREHGRAEQRGNPRYWDAYDSSPRKEV